MRTVFTFTFTMLLLAVSGLAHAVKIFECEDENGSRSFASHCPPGTTMVSEKKINLGTKTEAPAVSATMYYIPNCDACEQVREFFQLRQITLAEKNVDNNVEMQNELAEKAGELKVPTVVINDTVISGYDRNKMISALEAAGHSSPEPAAQPEPEPTPAPPPAETTSQPDTFAEQPAE